MAKRPETFHLDNESDLLFEVLSAEFTEAIEQAVLAQDKKTIKERLLPLEAPDLALLLEQLDASDRQFIIETIRQDFDYDTLLNLSDHVQSEVVEYLGIDTLAKHLAELDSDDAFTLIDELPSDQQSEILTKISASQRASYETILSYPEESAARMMQQEFVAVPSFWKVGDVLKFIQKSKVMPDAFYEIYVVDPKHHVVGVIPNSLLLRSQGDSPIRDIMKADFKSIPANIDQEEVAYLFRHYDLISAPVLDESGRVIGMITSDDVVDVIDEEAEKDLLQMARVSETNYNAPFYITSSQRIGWLVVTLINALLGAFVIDYFHATIEQKGSLAAFMTIVAAMGGANGMQVIAVTMRACSTRLINTSNMWRPVLKESLVGLMNAIVFSLITTLIVFFWFKDPSVAVILPLALIFNMVWASLGGVLVTLAIEKLGFDPAVSAGPVLTATTDVLGFASFLGLATLIL
jgi:magnesium transporter